MSHYLTGDDICPEPAAHAASLENISLCRISHILTCMSLTEVTVVCMEEDQSKNMALRMRQSRTWRGTNLDVDIVLGVQALSVAGAAHEKGPSWPKYSSTCRKPAGNSHARFKTNRLGLRYFCTSYRLSTAGCAHRVDFCLCGVQKIWF